MRYFSVFSGIGGFELGLDRAYWGASNIGKSIPHKSCDKQPQCIGYSEIDKYAIKIYEKHFKGHKNYGDATRIDTGDLPDFDLLCGGFPCQAFSIAGKRGGFEDTRGTLFHEIARIARAKRPKLLFLENVKGLLSHDKGYSFGTILATLSELGYILEWEVLNSKDYGVPQNRERVFIIGHLGEGCGQAVFPIGKIDQGSVQERAQDERKKIAWVLRGRDYKDGTNFICSKDLKQIGNIDTKGHNSLWGRVYDPDGVSANLNARGGGMGAKTGLYQVKPVLTPDRLNKRQNGRRIKENGEPAFSLTAQDKHGVMVGSRIRRLTPTECERLQGFPDGWTEGVSDSQRYKCLGNAVTINVIQAISERLLAS